MGNGIPASIHERLPNGETTRRWSLDDYDSRIYSVGSIIVEGFSSHSPTTRKALRDACRRGLLDRVVACVETHKVPLNHSTTIIGNSPLILSILNGHLHVVKYLVQAGVNVNSGNRVGVSPIFIACIFGRTEIVKYLANLPETDLFKVGGEGRTPLFRACADGDFRLVRILLDSIHFKSPLGDEKRQKEYIDKKNNPLYQHTPFYTASWRGFLDIMQYLEELNADIDSPCANLLRPSDAARPYVKPFFDLIQLERGVHMKVDNPQWPNDACLETLKGADGTFELWFAMNEGNFLSKRSKKLLLMYGSKDFMKSDSEIVNNRKQRNDPVRSNNNDRTEEQKNDNNVTSAESTLTHELTVDKTTIVKGKEKSTFRLPRKIKTTAIACVEEGFVEWEGTTSKGGRYDTTTPSTSQGQSNDHSPLDTFEPPPLPPIGTTKSTYTYTYGHDIKLERLKDSKGRTLLHRVAKNAGSFLTPPANLVNLLNFGVPPLRDENNKEYYDHLTAHQLLHLLCDGEDIGAHDGDNIGLTYEAICFHDYSLWFVMIGQEPQDSPDSLVTLYEALKRKVKQWLEYDTNLAYARNKHGAIAIDVASKEIKAVMREVILWHGRYRIADMNKRPEHMSATCFVFKAVDDEDLGKPIALKLMKNKAQFRRELTTRVKGFDQQYVMGVLKTFPEVNSEEFYDAPDDITNVEADATGQLTKTNAEKLYLLVMPLADRNLFVALKQERWAGKSMEEVRHVFVQLVHCVEHMHEKGVLHADLKPLNIVRTEGQWTLIDLDAACVIGEESVGHKSSSAYVPPEAIYVDEKNDLACVRSATAVAKGEANYDLLTAHPSFDIWSLGCILYQMCTADVKPLFQGGQDDNLVGTRKGVDNLFALAEWSPELKADKLADVPDKLARNLLSQMLHKDPLQRPTLARVLGHPMLSGKKVARLVGEKPKYDVFLSYRVASDAHHVEKLYNLLTAQGFKVYWDKFCLEPGVDWEQGFCEGLVSSRAFVPLLSRDAINHPDKAWQNFSKLTTDSRCDNVFLEHRLAVELQELGLIEKLFPVFIGNLDATTSEYSHYFGSGCHPSLPEVSVKSVEEKLRHHMESQALGTPLQPNRTVASVVNALGACQGAFIVGPTDATFTAAAASIVKMLTEKTTSDSSSPDDGTTNHTLSDTKLQTLLQEVQAKEEEVKSGKETVIALSEEINSLKGNLDRVLKQEFNTVDEARIIVSKVKDLLC